jgi:hypothetical protein
VRVETVDVEKSVTSGLGLACTDRHKMNLEVWKEHIIDSPKLQQPVFDRFVELPSLSPALRHL